VGCPVVLYNIPSRVVIDVPNDLLAELAEIQGVVAVKQANPDNLALVDGLDILAGNDDMLADALDMGGTGGILVSSHLVGREMRRMIDEPDRRREIATEIAGVLEAVSAPGVATNPIPIKAALNMLGHDVGGLRLPMVEASEEEKAAIHGALERHGLLSRV
jgi:4-hydroxy-tetrahydrodipicolinate synthase